jgi:hypothetical protein
LVSEISDQRPEVSWHSEAHRTGPSFTGRECCDSRFPLIAVGILEKQRVVTRRVFVATFYLFMTPIFWAKAMKRGSFL